MERPSDPASQALSVVVCTMNRAATLALVLQALADQTPAAGGFEVVVVDNGSTDATPHVVAALGPRLAGPLLPLAEPRPGLAVARETGWRASRGELVAFLDDDAVPAAGWAEEVLGLFRDHPDAVALGGVVRPRLLSSPPPWFGPRLLPFLSIWEPPGSERTVPLERRHRPVGANMVFRRALLEAVGGFDTRLGARGDRPFGGEDDDMFSQAFRLGRVYGSRGAAVEHLIGPERLTRSYLRRVAVHRGSSARLLPHGHGLAARLRAAVVVPVASAGWLATSAVRRPDLAFLCELKIRQKLAFLLAETARPHDQDSRPRPAARPSPGSDGGNSRTTS